MPDEQALRAHARYALQNGKLPSRTPDRTYGGRGVGADCAICQVAIPKTEVELEMEFQTDADGGVDTFHAHFRCFAAWELERTRLTVAAVAHH